MRNLKRDRHREGMSTVVQTRPLLTLEQVAERLNVSTRTVRRLIDRGLPAVQLGGPGTSVRVDAAELAAWLYSPAGVSTSFGPRLPEDARDGLGRATTAEPSACEGDEAA